MADGPHRSFRLYYRDPPRSTAPPVSTTMPITIPISSEGATNYQICQDCSVKPLEKAKKTEVCDNSHVEKN